jgi:hypothetical protein
VTIKRARVMSIDPAVRAAVDAIVPAREPRRFVQVGGVQLSEGLLRINPDLVAMLDAKTSKTSKVPRWRRPVEVTSRREGDAILLTMKGLCLVSELNEREHWRTRSARKEYQQDIVSRALGGFDPPTTGVRVSVVRVGPSMLDAADNLPASAKHLLDAVARWAGVNDGDVDRWRAEVTQERGGYCVRVVITGGAS